MVLVVEQRSGLRLLVILTVISSFIVTGQALGKSPQKNKAHLGTAVRFQYKVLPVTFDWNVATSRAERIFPGTKQWLLDCSSGEGGHGRAVWNTEGSGAYGWMQFKQSTYDSYKWAAYQEMLKRGYKLQFPDRFIGNGWGQPLGQALTAAYMRTIGISHVHWKPSIDSNCQ